MWPADFSSLDLSLVPKRLLSTVIVNIYPCQLNTNYRTHVSACDVDMLVISTVTKQLFEVV
jgi:hypothetical protein